MAYRGGGRRGRVVYTMPAGPQGTTAQSFEPFPYNLGFEFDNGVQVFSPFVLPCIMNLIHVTEYQVATPDR